MRLDTRAVIEPEHTLDDAGQIGGDLDLAGADPERAPALGVALELDAERLLHRLDRPGQIDGALREAHARHDESVRVREGLDLCDITGVGAVQRPEFVVVERPEISRFTGRCERGAASQAQRYRDFLRLGCRADALAGGERRLLAALQRYAARFAGICGHGAIPSVRVAVVNKKRR